MKYVLLLILTWNIAWAETDPSQLVFGFIPSGSDAETTEASNLVAEHLRKNLGVNVKVFVSKNYSEMIESIDQNKVDFAFLTAMTYVIAEKKSGVKVLLKKVWDEPFYYSIIITKNLKINGLKDLKGKKIAFVDANSTSGYLHPMMALKKNKIEQSQLGKVLFSGNHAASVELLEKGEVDAVAVFSDDKKGKNSAWQKYAKNPKTPFKVLWTSDPIPNDPLIVRKDFYNAYPKLTHNLMFSLIDLLDEKRDNPSIKKYFGAHSLVPSTSRQYEPVRELVNEFNPRVE